MTIIIFEVSVVHEPVNNPGSEPYDLHRMEVDLLKPRGGKRLQPSLTPYDDVTLGAGQVHVRRPAADAVRGRGVVDGQV